MIYTGRRQRGGVSLSSPTPAPRAVAIRDVSLSHLARRVHQFAICHRARPAAVRYPTWETDTLLTLRTLPL